MKMDRNLNADGKSKYAVVRLRNISEETANARYGLSLLQEAGVLDWGRTGEPDEFFVIRLKDKYAHSALSAYAAAAEDDDPEWANEVLEMAERSGPNHPCCKRPD